ncbi:MAG: hypothetical protein HY691_11905 [Chloroflexi bacterium]|nr:hypothetical protein [Chloroflexota bacterium]
MGKVSLVWTRALRVPLSLFVVSRLFVLLVGEVAILATAPPGELARTDLHNPLFVWWQRGDAGWYTEIVEQGYRYDHAQQSSVAFFPGYPAAVWLVRLLVPHTTLAGSLVSNAALLGARCAVYARGRARFGAPAAGWGAALLAFQPFGFYFSVTYSESLFLLAAALAVWAAERGRWHWAAAAAALAIATRLVGVALLPALVLPPGAQWLRPTPRQLAVIAAGALVPMAFAAYLWLRFGDGLAFATNNVATWGDPWHVLALVPDRMAQLVSPQGLRLTEYGALMSLNIATLLACLAITLWCWRLLGPRLGVFAALAALIPLATTLSFASGRYAAVIFPVYLALGARLPGAANGTLLLVFAAALAAFTARYVTGGLIW